ncbi:MAG: 2TM domain-containing protein [Bacteroidota bacterium]
METEAYKKYDRAKKRVKEIKGFYTHVRIFVIVNVLVYVTRFLVLPKLGLLPEDEGFIDWLNWNTYLMPLFWGLGLAIHGLCVFGKKFKPFQKWEERKIEEILRKENESGKRNYE